MIATAANGVISIWDYEVMRLIGAMTNQSNDILALEFLDPYPLLCSLDNSGSIIIWDPLK